MIRSSRAVLLTLLFLVPAQAVSAEESVPIGSASLNIITYSGREIHVYAEVAFTDEQPIHGKTLRSDMADDHGMLFILPSSRLAKMLIKDPPATFDMLFIDSYGMIREIKTELASYSHAIVSSNEAVHYVVELKGGMAARFGLQPGDRVKFPVFAGETHPVIKVGP